MRLNYNTAFLFVMRVVIFMKLGIQREELDGAFFGRMILGEGSSCGRKGGHSTKRGIKDIV